MYIYAASSALYRTRSLVKLGCTQYPHTRRMTYLTGCPPDPSYEIEFDMIWETTALTRNELFAMEDEIHNRFNQYRMVRETPGDSEWFNFQNRNPYEEVRQFMESRTWVKREVSLSEITPPKRLSRYLRKPYQKNLHSIHLRTMRDVVLTALQEPVQSAIVTFMADPMNRAGFVIAPCGSGKTIMTSKGIQGVQKCIICCPSTQIQNQWRNTLLTEGIFTDSQIHIIGGSGTTDPVFIRQYMKTDVFCILSTYMSSHLLVEWITGDIELLVLDEAHHMAGVVAHDERGEGRTRRLMLKASDQEIKRLSLTYTPRFMVDGGDGKNDTEYLTMDDERIFGKKIAELKIRDLIRKGVLPDYRLWMLRDKAKKGTGIIGKAECILEAWDATEMVRGAIRDDVEMPHMEEKHILHHLIIFAATTSEAKTLEAFFQAKTTNILVLRVGEDEKMDTNTAIAEFTSAPRAILINCFVLNEGVDIPIANAVAITYPKQSRGQITQMILRAGRWYDGKHVFHVLLPTLGDEDLSGFEEVLSALASCDDQIRDEILLRSLSVNGTPSLPLYTGSNGTSSECIMIEEFEADQEIIKQCFTNIRKNLFPVKESRRIRELCQERGVDTSVEYTLLRSHIPELPEDPRPKGMTWYDYLHPSPLDLMRRMEASVFVTTILLPNQLRVGHIYDEWRGVQSMFPTIQHITDGFFGKDDINFNSLLEKYGKKIGGQGRRR